MTTASALFPRLAADLTARLSRPITARTAARWAAREPVLGGIDRAVGAVTRCSDRDPHGHPREALAALIRLAGDDRLAAEAALAAVIPALRAVAGELTRAWRADPAEVDQAVAAAGWERIVRVAGRSVAWPDRVIAMGARDAVRDRLRAAARRRPPDPFDDDPGPGPGTPSPVPDPGEPLEVADLVRRAVAGRVVTGEAAAVVWDVRVLRATPAEVAARTGRRPEAVRVQCRRAERALRLHLAAGDTRPAAA